MADNVADTIEDFRAFLNDSLATHAYAAMGLMHENELLDSFPTIPENPDPMIHLGTGDPDNVYVPYTRWPLSEARVQLRPGGPIEQRLSQQWIVYTYTAWEHEYRPRLAEGHGCEAGDLKIPLLGDLRRMRHDVVHHHGVATAANSGKCELLGHWITIGSPIHVTAQQFAEFWSMFPWSDLASRAE